jgi:hypothetical protein
MASGRPRRNAAAACGVIGILLILTALLLGYATRSVFNAGAFATRVASSLEDARVAEYVSEQIADAVIKSKPDLIGLRPVLVGAARGIVSTLPFRAAVRRAVRAAHQTVFSGAGKEIVLDVQDVGVLMGSMVETNPKLASKIPPRLAATIGRLSSLPGGERAARLARFANRMRAGSLALLLVGVLFCTAGVWLSSAKREAIMRTGMALAALGVLLAFMARFGGDVLGLLSRQADYSPALTGLASAFLGGLMLWAIGLALGGLVLAAASASLLERVPLHHLFDASRHWLAGPQENMRWRLARGIVGGAIGGAFLLWPLPSLTVVAWLCGVLIAFAGLREVFIAVLHLLPPIERTAHTTSDGRSAAPRWAAVALVGGIAVALLAATTWWVVRPKPSAAESEVITACNGSAALCDRRLDQVVFPTSHNSMGGADLPGWMFPSQNAGIAQQLTDGVRGFLIDAHYGVQVGDKVKTELQDEKAAMAKYESAIGKEGMAAVLRIRDRLAAEKQGERDVYMCHGFCELGAVKLVPQLQAIRDFLVENPGEVLIIVIQDESVTPQDIERCCQESGLVDFVYRGPARPPWPTLREMVESDQRVLIMAENATAGVDWYHPAFEVMQETPYEFHDPSEFSNRPNRGGTAGSLYLLNHWIETTPMPKPSNAAIVNAHDALLARVEAFRRERGHLPNLLAVDFYGTGDLISVVRELNDRPPASARGGTRAHAASMH